MLLFGLALTILHAAFADRSVNDKKKNYNSSFLSKLSDVSCVVVPVCFAGWGRFFVGVGVGCRSCCCSFVLLF